MTSVSQFVGRAAWFLVAAGASSAATTWLIGWATSHGVFDVPNARSSHTRVTPRGGGIAIVAVTSWAAIIAACLWPEAAWPLAGYLIPALAIAGVSWLDDLKPLRNRVRFGVHLGAAAAAAAVAGPVDGVSVGGSGTILLGYAAWPLSLLWIAGMTNAFNFMDGIDGIAGLTAAVAGATLAVAAASVGLEPVASVSLAFAGAAIGFLTCNWPPARIFMGDVGSAFCGFTIAVLPMLGGHEAAARLVPVTAVAMWPFIFDTAYTLLRRLLNGENVFKAHRSHLYQRLVIAGWPHRAASTLYGFLAAFAAAIAVAPLCGTASDRTATSLTGATIVVGIVLLLVLVRTAERSSVSQSPPA